MMRRPSLSRGLVVAALLTALPSASFASRMAEQATGTVTSLSIGDRIVVDGHPYEVMHNDTNALTLLKLKVGDRVQLQMNGPAGNPATRVFSVVPANAVPVSAQ